MWCSTKDHTIEMQSNLNKTMVVWSPPAIFSHLVQAESREEFFYRFGAFPRECCIARKGKRVVGYTERKYLQRFFRNQHVKGECK